MRYEFNYEINQIHCDGKKTRVVIVNSDTGEVFYGDARLNPADTFNIRIGANVALSRAITKMVTTDMQDWQVAIEDGCGWMI